jgi:hypothetical protein
MCVCVCVCSQARSWKHLAVKNNIFHVYTQFKHITFQTLRLFNRGSEMELRYRSVISVSKEPEQNIWL